MRALYDGRPGGAWSPLPCSWPWLASRPRPSSQLPSPVFCGPRLLRTFDGACSSESWTQTRGIPWDRRQHHWLDARLPLSACQPRPGRTPFLPASPPPVLAEACFLSIYTHAGRAHPKRGALTRSEMGARPRRKRKITGHICQRNARPAHMRLPSPACMTSAREDTTCLRFSFVDFLSRFATLPPLSSLPPRSRAARRSV